ncbi:hypothetical protein DDW11_03695 [Sulfolobus sp. SCGC AB-777_G06]|nr:hypothetical protein DDW11_03695 [Sulfolobus sp. SCGC AB-777_G06]
MYKQGSGTIKGGVVYTTLYATAPVGISYASIQGTNYYAPSTSISPQQLMQGVNQVVINYILLFIITGKAIDDISKAYPDTASVLGYTKLVLYAVFILIAIGIIVQPFGNVTAIIQTYAWGSAIAFAIIIPLVYALAKKIIQ